MRTQGKRLAGQGFKIWFCPNLETLTTAINPNKLTPNSSSSHKISGRSGFLTKEVKIKASLLQGERLECSVSNREEISRS